MRKRATHWVRVRQFGKNGELAVSANNQNPDENVKAMLEKAIQLVETFRKPKTEPEPEQPPVVV
jgi:hypothetical protein